ncbi:DUF3140 domain-containing protein [Flavobacteriaceae bacterium TP-CH-4]|uniref:DUF3140 domain-containing protein n=1 Tax=Pelagihabitans pacificus TaxID=2696054 RepID=A0A967AW46_9FLAO|nr:DUF3140 domain-containing protein [Pelagihabitans pacificus]NHF61268.1 DUF3140 domain-containing protein [Pelagihabitans pacificus]
MADYDKEEIWREFQEKQNMSNAELEEWLETETSKNAGKEMENGETIGHRAGRSILKIKQKKKSELTESNWDRINETVGVYHQKINPSQKPNDNIENSNWYYSLKNWGHDALK